MLQRLVPLVVARDQTAAAAAAAAAAAVAVAASTAAAAAAAAARARAIFERVEQSHHLDIRAMFEETLRTPLLHIRQPV